MVLAACGTAAEEPAKSAAPTGASAGRSVANGATQAESATGSGSGAETAAASATSIDVAPAAASGNAAARPSGLELEPGETLTDPVIETVWKTPGGAVTATVVEASEDHSRFHKLVVWGHGKRYDVAKATEICDVAVEIRRVRDGQIVFRCQAPNPGLGSGSLVYSWLIRWRKDKNAPVRHRYWQGDGAAREPRWARPYPPPPARYEQCCCEATMEDRTTYAWEDHETCKPSEEDERSAFCVENVRCRGIKD